MPQERSSRPQPQHWIKFLDPWMQDFYPVLGWVWHPRREIRDLFLTPALDKNRFPNIVFTTYRLGPAKTHEMGLS